MFHSWTYSWKRSRIFFFTKKLVFWDHWPAHMTESAADRSGSCGPVKLRKRVLNWSQFNKTTGSRGPRGRSNYWIGPSRWRWQTRNFTSSWRLFLRPKNKRIIVLPVNTNNRDYCQQWKFEQFTETLGKSLQWMLVEVGTFDRCPHK